MYFDEFYVALPFIEKSLYENGRDIRSYLILNEIFTELLPEKLPIENRVLSAAQCLDPLKGLFEKMSTHRSQKKFECDFKISHF